VTRTEEDKKKCCSQLCGCCELVIYSEVKLLCQGLLVLMQLGVRESELIVCEALAALFQCCCVERFFKVEAKSSCAVFFFLVSC